MPYDDPDPTDPMTLHGVMVETDDPQAMTAMAECFIEEFARMGFEPQRIYRLFLNPGYAGPFMARNALGDERIQSMINGYWALRGPNPRNGCHGSGNVCHCSVSSAAEALPPATDPLLTQQWHDTLLTEQRHDTLLTEQWHPDDEVACDAALRLDREIELPVLQS